VSLAVLVVLAAVAHPDLDAVESLVIDGTNRYRASQGLGTVSPNPRLEQAARAFANQLADGGAFSHDSGGTTPEIRIRRAGYRECVVAENLARRYDTAGYTTRDLAQKLVQGWIDSPGHRRNMLEADALETGVAVVSRRRDRYEEFFAVQLFARDEAAAVRFRVRNRAAAQVSYRVNGKAFTLDPNWGREHNRCSAPDLLFEGRARGHFEAAAKGCYVVPPSGEVRLEPGGCE
jgi:hypothetical protein